MIILKSPQEIECIRWSGRVTALALEEIEKAAQEGITTLELDRIAESFIRRHGGRPAFKGYRGFPRSVTISVNEEVVHGIPGKRRLKSGDIVSIDMGVELGGFVSDAAVTLIIGEAGEKEKKLLKVTQESLARGIQQAREGNRIGDISYNIQSYVEENGFSVVRDLVGHGIGRSMHEEPQVPNYGQPGFGALLCAGMVLAIEPMVNMGGAEVKTLQDNWTVVTQDRSPSAHFEHTVAVTKNGPRILTLP